MESVTAENEPPKSLYDFFMEVGTERRQVITMQLREAGLFDILAAYRAHLHRQLRNLSVDMPAEKLREAYVDIRRNIAFIEDFAMLGVEHVEVMDTLHTTRGV